MLAVKAKTFLQQILSSDFVFVQRESYSFFYTVHCDPANLTYKWLMLIVHFYLKACCQRSLETISGE